MHMTKQVDLSFIEQVKTLLTIMIFEIRCLRHQQNISMTSHRRYSKIRLDFAYILKTYSIPTDLLLFVISLPLIRVRWSCFEYHRRDKRYMLLLLVLCILSRIVLWSLKHMIIRWILFVIHSDFPDKFWLIFWFVDESMPLLTRFMIWKKSLLGLKLLLNLKEINKS